MALELLLSDGVAPCFSHRVVGTAFFAQAETLEIIADAMQREEVSGYHTEVIVQGRIKGDKFYVVGDGAFEYVVDGRPVGHAGPGECFGELALLYDSPRAATCRLSSDSAVVYTLERGDFKKTLMWCQRQTQQSDTDQMMEILRPVALRTFNGRGSSAGAATRGRALPRRCDVRFCAWPLLVPGLRWPRCKHVRTRRALSLSRDVMSRCHVAMSCDAI